MYFRLEERLKKVAFDTAKRLKMVIKDEEKLEAFITECKSNISKSNDLGKVDSCIELVNLLEKKHEIESLVCVCKCLMAI